MYRKLRIKPPSGHHIILFLFVWKASQGLMSISLSGVSCLKDFLRSGKVRDELSWFEPK